ncbi:hypothetical protein EK21DRAFT_108451 [Setomelanomma holmii]|uniref:Uncharacterized protein n=1 Tax=Setomelanomma holmii TaxID=210430 RepID=A0A9P4LNM7_9PLEO|nr:hypothetical protein EK21DRAFT_108451 [Setomelanomma holmii]
MRGLIYMNDSKGVQPLECGDQGVDEVDDTDIIIPGLMSDRLRAACNIFGPGLTVLAFQSKIYTVQLTALQKYCTIAAVQDGDWEPEIIRAFLNTTSPTLGKRLPRHDYLFHAQNIQQAATSKDPLSVMGDWKTKVTKLPWDVEKLISFHSLCKRMGCTAVQDLIIGELHQHYAEHRQLGTPIELERLFAYLDDLNPAGKDMPLIKLIIDILIDCVECEELSNLNVEYHAIQAYIDKRSDKKYGLKKILHSTSRKKLCNEYHLHRKNETCPQHVKHTSQLKEEISSLYDLFKEELARSDDNHASGSINDMEIDSVDATQRTRQRELLLWSHDLGKKVAGNLLRFESLKEQLESDEIYRGEAPEGTVKIMEHSKHRVAELRKSHTVTWEKFRGTMSK